MTTFADLGLSDSVLAAVHALGYTEPTPVQEQSIPLALAGRDMIAAAKTGTGKTAAFSLPSLDRLQRADRKKSPTMLVITPTRELAMQIQEVSEVIAKARGLRVANVVGGVKIEPQMKVLARGVDVLIATPGRLIDLMNQKAVDLSDVQILVLDEADRMLDMGFLPSVRRIVEATPATRQTLLFSATIDKGVLDQVDAMLNDPAIVQIAAKGETADTVEQYIARVPHTLKPDLLAALLKERGAKRVIVFARTRHRADAACRKLKRAGYHAEAIHSDRSQNQRKRALDNFAAGTTDILVATDVLARGIDVDEVSYVVNYDVPTQAEDYVHRIGRTGRAGAEGFAVTFVSPENKDELAAIEKLIRRPIPEMEVAGFNLEEAAEAAAARATRANAKHDPELAAAAREQSKKEKRRAKEKERAETEAAEARQRGTRKKPSSRSAAPKPAGRTQTRAGKASSGNNRKGAASAAGRKGPDLRPGRAHRAAVAAKRGGKRRG
ncbi:DEAD/DEAH box helicase [Adlercreutzia sp. R21]|uniref:DEAD/DEAH box helicase n=1 Tax=Adlercreutzia wanghongyangiae TaxID=3111451 RepID=UPI002DBCA6B0|nr:DEAD/DEAH box helicase [Adlercreutzia sp. R21]MEC4183335.1 DEAD/DEAH box helicase [Adlercreutzia sp. R21]